MKQVNVDELRKVVLTCQTLNEVYKKTGISSKKLKKLLKEYNINYEHFTPGIGKSTRARKFSATKICEFCKKDFIVNNKRTFEKQITCSYTCSNKLFRVGNLHANWKSYDEKPRKAEFYRRICFDKHGKKCIVCDEKFAVDVHHLDGNHKNNDISNLIPLCANHHRYMHMKETKELLIEQIKLYLESIAP